MARPSNEERISALEREVAELKRAMTSHRNRDWIAQVAGSFENDPDFEEIVRIGREIRQSGLQVEDWTTP